MTYSILQKNSFRKFLAILVFGISQISNAAPSMSGGLGSGIAWTARHTALFLNPAGLSSGDSKNSLYGLYGFETETVTSALTGGTKGIGYGLGVVYNADSDLGYLGGVAFDLNKLSFGLSAEKEGASDLGFNAGLNIDLSKLRISAVLHNLADPSQIDISVGFMTGLLRFEAGIANQWPMSQKNGIFFAGFVYNGRPLSISFGIARPYIDASLVGEFTYQAGIEIAIGQNLALQGEYHSNLDVSDYSAGLRLKF